MSDFETVRTQIVEPQQHDQHSALMALDRILAQLAEDEIEADQRLEELDRVCDERNEAQAERDRYEGVLRTILAEAILGVQPNESVSLSQPPEEHEAPA